MGVVGVEPELRRHRRHSAGRLAYPNSSKTSRDSLNHVPIFAPVLIGNDEPNHLVGTVRNDVIHGNGGNDTLVGGAGDDEIDGGNGNDAVIYSGNRPTTSYQLS